MDPPACCDHQGSADSPLREQPPDRAQRKHHEPRCGLFHEISRVHIAEGAYPQAKGLTLGPFVKVSPQLQAGDEPYETELNVDRLHSICVNQIQMIISSQFLLRTRRRLNQIRRIEPETAADVLDRDQLADVFIVHPTILLSLMEWHDEVFVERFGLLRHYHQVLTTADPLIGELLIDGEHIAQRIAEFEHTLQDQLSAFGDRIDRDLTLPGDFDTGLELLFYGFWYRELSQQRDKDLFNNPDIFERYDSAGLAEMARITLRGKQRVEDRREYEGLRKGIFDPIVRLMEGANDPTPQLESIITQIDSVQRQ